LAGNQPASSDRTQASAWEKFSEYFQICWRNGVRILVPSLVVTAVVAVLLLIQPGVYVATATILPDVQVLSALQKAGGVKELALAATLDLGITSPSQLYPAIITSEHLLHSVIYHEFDAGREGQKTLLELWEPGGGDERVRYEQILKKLRNGVIDVSVDRRTYITVLQVTTENPPLSAQIANVITHELDLFAREFRQKAAGEQREWIEKRLVEVHGDLSSAEERLKDFREANRRILDSPQLLLEQSRLAREVELQSTVYIELTKQLELAKIEEMKNIPVVQVLDEARVPTERAGPARRVLAATVFLVCLGVLSFLTILLERLRRDPKALSVVEKVLGKRVTHYLIDTAIVKKDLGDRNLPPEYPETRSK
jgi:uncharacterized protein involved in exopolysaccharide biosynthesis